MPARPAASLKLPVRQTRRRRGRVLAGLAAAFDGALERGQQVAATSRELLTPHGKVGVAWVSSQDPRWAPVIAAIDAHVLDGVPGFAAYMARPPFDEVAALEQTLRDAGYQDVRTGTRQITMIYTGPEQWWVTLQTQGPWALSWRHIPGEGLVEAKWEAFRLLEQLRDAYGSISRTLTFALTTARGRNG